MDTILTQFDNLLAIDEVVRRIAVSRVTIHRWCRDKIFPPPVQLGPRRIAWRESDLVAWLASRSTPVAYGAGAAAPKANERE
jgi:prophage regulatory protein